MPKSRSCVMCRRRKVRCDKTSPCTNCHRAEIPCVFPSEHTPPRWARRLAHVGTSDAGQAPAPDAGALGQVISRLRSLEGIVSDLGAQMQQVNAQSCGVNVSSDSHSSQASSMAGIAALGCHPEGSPSAADSPSTRSEYGRLVPATEEGVSTRYLSSGFWSHINDEIERLKMELQDLDVDDSSAEEELLDPPPLFPEASATPSQRHAFIYQHNLYSPMPSLQELHPLASQVPFLIDVFSENINQVVQVVHMPSVLAMTGSFRSGKSAPTPNPSEEALLFSIYYSAIISMEEDDVMASFSSSKSYLALRFRLGLEYALAKADFLNSPNLTLVQAFAIFLLLARRHDTPRFVWMLTGLLVRMAQALGLHRDGTRFPYLSPFEVEMRRRAWWTVCMVDSRASEDQDTDLAISPGSFDTRMPLNLNNHDIGPDTREVPPEREGMADMTFALVSYGMCDLGRQMVSLGLRDEPLALHEQSQLLDEVYEKLERTYLRHSISTSNVAYWIEVIISRLVVAKFTLMIYLPGLFSLPTKDVSERLRSKLLAAATEVAEYNHALNAEPAYRQWRWVYQTYTHWYAVVYILLAVTQRAWSPASERAWVALHSPWLIPAQTTSDSNVCFWFPLRKLMAKARRHRDAELERLGRNHEAARQLEADDRSAPQPASVGLLPGTDSVEAFRMRWRQLVSLGSAAGEPTHAAGQFEYGSDAATAAANLPTAGNDSLVPLAPPQLEHGELRAGGMPIELAGDGLASAIPTSYQSRNASDVQTPLATQRQTSPLPRFSGILPSSALQSAAINPSGAPYKPFPNTDFASDEFASTGIDELGFDQDSDGWVDWNTWVESAKKMEGFGVAPAGM